LLLSLKICSPLNQIMSISISVAQKVFLKRSNLKRQRISAMEYLSENIPQDDTDLCETLLMELDRKIDETAYTGQVIGNLNTNQHNLYRQRYVEGKSIKEIASEEGVSETAMRMRLVRLRKEIQDIVKKLKLGEK